MWCKNCNKVIYGEICETCGESAEIDIPVEIYWCSKCQIPIIKEVNEIDKNKCPICNSRIKYISTDLRPVFPEERLLFEALVAEPLKYINKSVWANGSRYFVDGKSKMLYKKVFESVNADQIRDNLNINKEENCYTYFNEIIAKFIAANQTRLNKLKDEAYTFIKQASQDYKTSNIVVSFSGGKDSTVTADLAVRALGVPNLVHIFGDTTLEFPQTIEYAKRFRKNNPKTIFKTARNNDQKFYDVCDDIGPPARMLRWCCYMFKTGPITRVINSLYRSQKILTFYGIRKCESASRSKYNRIENDAEQVKINNQTVGSPIFYWRDIDIWLYILGEGIDFNDAYRLGYDRVGCWCCPNNTDRAQFLSKIYMPNKSKTWRNFLISFAKRIGKPDPEVYVDTGKWKARQGGKGLKSAEDANVNMSVCTTEENAKIYKLNKPMDDNLVNLFIPFGYLSKSLGRKIIGEVIILDYKTKMPLISIQPYNQENYDFAVKVKTINADDSEDLHRMISYQIRKFNACRKCLKCESLCTYGAITIRGNIYKINEAKCKRCKMCLSNKYLENGCLMRKYLRVRGEH